MKKVISALAVVGVFAFSLVLPSSARSFSDVSSNHLNAEAVEFLRSAGAVSGFGDGNFRPEVEVTRAEALKMILQTKTNFNTDAGNSCLDSYWTTGGFRDVPKDSWFAPYVCYAQQQGFITGYSDGNFRPDDNVNLPEIAKMLVKVRGLGVEGAGDGEQWYLPYLKVMEGQAAIPATVDKIDHRLARAELAEMLYRVVENKTDRPTKSLIQLELQTGNLTSGGVGQISSCQQLSEAVKLSAGSINRRYALTDMAVMKEEVAVPAAAMEGGKGGGADTNDGESEAPADEYSQTNVQVAGVDEADIVKNDGQYIYGVKDNTVRIVQAYPADQLAQVAYLTFDDENFSPTELLLEDNMLVVIGSSWEEMTASQATIEGIKEAIATQGVSWEALASSFWTPSRDLTKVYLVDITDRAAPEVAREISYEGSYSTSRLAYGTVYLVINKSQNYFGVISEPRLLLPQVKDSSEVGGFRPACGCSDIHYFSDLEEVSNYMVVSAIPLDDPNQDITKEVYLGSSENVYMSPNALYIAATANDYSWWSWEPKTTVYKFGLDGLNIQFKVSGEVPGYTLNQFSMDEQDGKFRIATTSNKEGEESSRWSGGETINNIYVLDENMQQIGSLAGLAPGERIYSVRFMGDRAYMVTFRQVDPLFVIDLSNPASPQVLGYLKVPGYSNYLHPYDDTHLIGFGKEADEDGFFQGFKMSLFDVSDVANPAEMFKETIGDRYTDSELLNDHKALLFDKEKGLLAFPITVYEEEDCGEEDECDWWSNGDITFDGAMVYDITLQNGFKKRGEISSVDTASLEDAGWISYEDQIHRIIYMGENLYTISMNKIKAANMQTVEVIGELAIE